MSVLICVSGADAYFTAGKEYPVICESRGEYTIKDNYGFGRSVPLNGLIWQFEIKEEKHTAVSGDQSLFTLLKSPDDHLYVYSGNNNNILSARKQYENLELLAQRKPAKYIPAIGDKFSVEFGNINLTCHFVDYDNNIFCHSDKKEVYIFDPEITTFIKAQQQ